MVLFLTSSPCDDDVPAGANLPCIFFERNSFVENLRECMRSNAHLVVVAADPESFELNDEMMRTFVKCFAWHGLTIAEANLLDARTAENADELIGESDVIILGGGHVPTENAFFHEIGLRELLEGYEGVVIGISAGTMNCADEVYAQPELEGESIDPDYERFIEGLGLTDVNVLPHYQKVKNYLLDGKRLYEDITYLDSFGHAFFALPDGSYVLQDEDGAFLFGEGYCIADGVMEQICVDGEWVEL